MQGLYKIDGYWHNNRESNGKVNGQWNGHWLEVHIFALLNSFTGLRMRIGGVGGGELIGLGFGFRVEVMKHGLGCC